STLLRAQLWDVGTRQEIATLKGPGGPLVSVSFPPDGKTLAPYTTDVRSKLWDVGTRQEIATLKGPGGPLVSVVFSPDGKTLASRSFDGTVKLWNVATRQEIATLKGRGSPPFFRGAKLTGFHHDGKSLASGSDAVPV